MGKRTLRYEPSPKHCEPITAETPGVKCPKWSVAVAQTLLEGSVIMGQKRVAVHDGVAFVGQLTRMTDEEEIWHGYPEAWDKIDPLLKKRWLQDKKVTRKQLRTYKTRADVRNEFGGRLVRT